MTDTPTVEQLARALAATDELIVAIDDDQWSNPTPCPDWDVHALVNHLVFGTLLFGGLIRGEPLPPIEELRQQRTVDRLGDDPIKAYRDAGAALQAAVREPGALERSCMSPIGLVPGHVLLNLRICEVLVHGWDLAQATGQPPQLPDDVAEHALAFSRWQLEGELPRTGRFAVAQPVADDAPAIERLAAYLGRSVPET
jgi:uncharacterized protein (TIGR03086 family)